MKSYNLRSWMKSILRLYDIKAITINNPTALQIDDVCFNDS